MTERILLDPGSEHDPVTREPLPGPLSLEGCRVGLLDISKPRGDVFLDELEKLLGAQGASIERYAKPTFTRPAPDALRAEMAERCDVVLEGLAD